MEYTMFVKLSPAVNVSSFLSATSKARMAVRSRPQTVADIRAAKAARVEAKAGSDKAITPVAPVQTVKEQLSERDNCWPVSTGKPANDGYTYEQYIKDETASGAAAAQFLSMYA